jgi:hypothetical protein
MAWNMSTPTATPKVSSPSSTSLTVSTLLSFFNPAILEMKQASKRDSQPSTASWEGHLGSEKPVRIEGEDRVGSSQMQVFDLSLGKKKTIEGIPVVKRQFARRQGMCMLDLESL